MKALDLCSACPEVPERFDRMFEDALPAAGETRIPARHRIRTALIAALIAALLIAGLAYAASRSRILERLFPSGQPSEAAEQLVRPVKAMKADGPYSFSVDECLFDGNGLHVHWTARSEAGNLTFFTAGDLESPSVKLSQQGWTESLRLYEFVPLGDSLSGNPVSREFHGYTVVTLPDDADGKPFDVALRGVFMKPVAPIVMGSDIKEDIVNRATWVAEPYNGQIYLNYWSNVTRDPDGSGGSAESPDLAPYLDALTENSPDSQRVDAYVNALTGAGYAHLLSEIELTFTVSPDEAHIYRTEIDGPSIFEFSDRTVIITRAEFTAAHTSLTGTVTGKNGLTQDELFKLYYELRPDGQETDARISSQMDSAGPVGGSAAGTLDLWGDPLPKAPSYVLLEGYWYPNGFHSDLSDERNKPVRVPEYDIMLKLKKVP